MLDIRSSIFVAAGLTILAPAATAQLSTKPLKILDDVRDRRYCELFVVKRQRAHLAADIYNTLGLIPLPYRLESE
jgi:hypothetical protein